MTSKRATDDEIGLDRLLVALMLAVFWGGVLAVVGVPLSWEPVLWVAVPIALWVTWPVTVSQWRRLREPSSKQGPESKNRD